jgi:aspartokinase
MSRVRLGGIKAFEKRAYLTSFCRSGEEVLGDICTRLAADKINLSLLTHIADNGTRESITAACTASAEGFSSYALWKASHGQCSIGKLLDDISIISIFPHEKKLNVTGLLLNVLAENRIRPYGFASSPSAMAALVSSSDFEPTIYALFDVFEFPTYSSPLDWHAAYRGQEGLLDEIVCSYQEEIIKIYDLAYQSDLDLWTATVPFEGLGEFSKVLLDLHELQFKMPFLVSKSSSEFNRLYFAFCLPAAYHEEAMRAFDRNSPQADLFCHHSVSVIFLHGPHFGDRYGIANALVKTMWRAGVFPLAMSCAVSSLSVVIEGSELNKTLAALNSGFKIATRER